MTSQALYYIGIDLGTSNCALSYMAVDDPHQEISLLDLQQWQEDGIVSKPTLPSFAGFLSKSEVKNGQCRLPFHQDQQPLLLLGHGAKERALKTPDQVIHSAKSWLCHKGVDRTGKILPWHSDSIIGDRRLSPVEVSCQFLKHLKGCWDASIGLKGPKHQFNRQTIAITVPASFDAIAQELTLQAAAAAGYPRSTKLLEEPMSAFYGHRPSEGEQDDGLILVCDIGGGTSDFTLLDRTGGKVERIRVSPHTLLGGDNIDQALAHFLELRLSPQEPLASYPWAQLLSVCRRLKESVCSNPQQEDYHISIDKGGMSLLDSTLSCHASAKELLDIIRGFFPSCPPRYQLASQEGLREWGLPYPQDPAISHHLSAFLNGQAVDYVLFAGGTMNPKMLRQLILDLLSSWQQHPPQEMQEDCLDLLVARGASRYLLCEATQENLVASPYPKTLYLRVTEDSQSKALCILEKGRKREQAVTIQGDKLRAYTNQRVSFQILESHRDDESKPGDILDLEATMTEVCSVSGTLDLEDSQDTGEIPVSLVSLLTETGLLKLECRSPQGKTWPLNFDLEAPVSPQGGHAPKPSFDFSKVTPLVRSLYGKRNNKASLTLPPRQLGRTLEEIWQSPKHDWDIGQLRQLWTNLEPGLTRRGRSLDHEAAWLNLAGFCLRPGYGHKQDGLFIDSAWRLFQLGLNFPNDGGVQDQWWIFWRRIAGGLNRERQQGIFQKIAPLLKKDRAPSPQAYLLAGSLERVNSSHRIQLGNALAQQIATGSKAMLDSKIWCLSRLASRVPLYGGPETIIRPSNLSRWADTLAPLNIKQSHYRKLEAFYSLGGRQVNDREFDIDLTLRQHFLEKLQHLGSDDRNVQQVANYLSVDLKDQDILFGEALPGGLFLL